MSVFATSGTLGLVAAALVTLAGPGCSRQGAGPESQAATTQEAAQPATGLRAKNVILISIDAQRPDHLGCYGYARPTSPNIGALCPEGWVFEQAYCATPRTGPSVASLHTGMFPPEVREWKVRTRIRTMAEQLAARGYLTAAAARCSQGRVRCLDIGRRADLRDQRDGAAGRNARPVRSVILCRDRLLYRHCRAHGEDADEGYCHPLQCALRTCPH